MPKPNRVKAAIREGRVALGYSMNFPSPHVIEILAPMNFDYVWLDGEHGPFGLESLEDHCRAADAVGITPIARVPNIQTSTILQYLDRGIQGILGPHIASKADAEQLVKACYFGPIGERSFGGNRGCDYDYELTDRPGFYKTTNDNTLVGALLEDKGVIDNLEEIVSVDGIDYFSIGPNDFAQGLGYPGGKGRTEVIDAMEDVYSRVRKAGRRAGGDVMRGMIVKESLVSSARQFFDAQHATP